MMKKEEGLPWLKMWKKFATDIKVQELKFEDQRHWVMILCLRCGYKEHQKNTDNRMSVFLRLSDPKVKKLKQILMSANMIDIDWNPVNWDEYQANGYNSAERTRKYRENKQDW